MWSKAIFVALLAFVFGAQGALVSSEQAAKAARVWINRGKNLPSASGAVSVSGVSDYRSGGSSSVDAPSFYVVTLSTGGAMVLSANTESSPVVVYAPSGIASEQLEDGKPLKALLDRDAAIRARGDSESPKAEWDELLTAPEESNGAGGAAPGHVDRVAELDDVRVRPLVQSRWSQGDVGEHPCFNRFTPVLSDGKNAVCGCVATAMAQLMRYHRFPVEARASVTNTCTVEAASRGNPAAETNLVTQGGIYDWANMPIVPDAGDPNIETQCEAIGKLTSDAGIAVGMNYDVGESGSFSFNIAPALMEVFGYANAEYYRAEDADKGFPKISTSMERAMFANLDAGYPVLMGISGSGGHQIVGDGYGYKDGQPYVHLNMGWGSVDDVWYNLPQIDCETAGFHFTVFQDIVFNVFPTAGEGNAILSGRIVDENGNAVSNVTVTVRQSGNGEQVAKAVNLESGVYGFRVPASLEGTRFVVRAVSADGEEVGLTEGDIVVRTSMTTLQDYTGWIVKDDWSKMYRNRPVVTDVGNSWGNPLTVVPAPVRIGTVPYSFLDEALDAVAAGADVIEVLRPVLLRAPRTVSMACTIVATNGVPSDSAVTRIGEAALTVAAGGQLSLSNLVFAAGSNTVIDVKSGGRLEVAGVLDFGLVPADVPSVRTVTEDGFILGGELSERLVLACEAAKDIGGTFGFATCDYECATNGVRRIANGYDPGDELMAVAVTNLAGEISLEWDERPVPLEACAGFYIDGSGKTNTAANLDRVFEKYERAVSAGLTAGPHEIVITMNSPDKLVLARLHEVKTDLTIRTAEPNVVLSNFTENAGIALSDGQLVVDGITFVGYRGDGLLVVDGADAKLTVTNSAFRAICGTGDHSGAIAVLKGEAFVFDTVFEDCTAGDPRYQNTSGRASGGAIYLKGTGCELHLNGGVITGCRALTSGGGVFVGNGAMLGISGDLQACGNRCGDEDNDIYVGGKDKDNGAYSVLRLEGMLGDRTNAVGVLYGSSGNRSGYGNAPEQKFIDVSNAVAADEVARMSGIRTIFSDYTPTLDRVYDKESKTLKWTTAASSRKVDVGPVSLSGCSDEANGDYAFLADAIEAIDGNGAVIQVKEDVAFADTLTISNTVFIVGDGARTVTRVGDVSIKVVGCGDLNLKSVVFDGGDGAVRLFDVDGGSMTLGAGAVIRNVNGSYDRAAGGVVVQNGGIFTMETGAMIRDCVNAFVNDGSKAGYCGGLLADNSKVYFHGGTISGCAAYGAGGAFAGNDSEVFVSGAFTNIDNRTLSGELSNLKVADKSKLYLDGSFTGFCGYTEGAQGDTRQFGEIRFEGSNAQYAESAHRFTHDITEDIGQAVVGSAGKLLVWNDALDDKTYTDGKGNDYALVEGGNPIFVAVPQAKAGLAYTGEEQVGVEAGQGYSLVGNVAVDAGLHTATATLKSGYAWVGGSTAPENVGWTIAKGDFNLDGVEFPDDEFICDGRPKSLSVQGDIPDGITVTYDGNGQTSVGAYEVKAILSGGDANHNPTSVTMTATLRIVEDPQVYPPGPVPPEPTEVTNTPTPIAFQSITRVSDLEWALVVTSIVPKCEYRLIYTDDLTKGFTVTGAWERAADDAASRWETNVLFTTENAKPAYFWRAEGRQTIDVISNED